MLLVKIITRRVNLINYIYKYFEMQNTMIFVVRLRDTAILILIVMLIRYTDSLYLFARLTD